MSRKKLIFIIIHFIYFQSINGGNHTKELQSEHHQEELSRNNFEQDLNITSSIDEQHYRKCSYNTPKYCLSHTQDMVALYAKVGGWILLCVLLCIILYKTLMRLIAYMNRNHQAAFHVYAENLSEDDNHWVNQNGNRIDYVQVEQCI